MSRSSRFLPARRSLSRLCVLLTGGVTLILGGCRSSSGTFWVKNPFPEEAEAVAGWLDPAKRSDEASPRGWGFRRRQAPGAEPAEETPASPYPYFGRGEATGTAPAETARSSSTPGRIPPPPLPAGAAGATLAAAAEAPPANDPAAAPPPAAAPSSPPSSASSPSPAVAVARSTGGKPCYQCNGKGYRLSSLAEDAEFVPCQSCGGSGRSQPSAPRQP